MSEENILNAIGNIDDKIIESTLNSKRKIKFTPLKKAIAIIAAVIIVIGGCSIAIAKAPVIWSYNIGGEAVEEVEGITIEKNPDIKAGILYSTAEINNKLGVSLITSELINDEYYYQPIIEDDVLMRIDLWNSEALSKEGNKNLSILTTFLTQNATEKYNPKGNDLDAAGGKVLLENYHIKQLDCDAVIYTFEDFETRNSVDILYENIRYHYIFDNFTLDEVKGILDTLYI